MVLQREQTELSSRERNACYLMGIWGKILGRGMQYSSICDEPYTESAVAKQNAVGDMERYLTGSFGHANLCK